MSDQSSNRITPLSRRDFLRISGGCAALTSTSFLSTLLNLNLTRSAVAAVGNFSDYKAMVCIFLHGGNDSFNMLTPYEQTEYDDYVAARTDLALLRPDLLPITDTNGRQFGIHPGMPEVQELFNQGNLGFIANVGSLVAPTDTDDYNSRVNLPAGLFSHNDQQRHWQTSVPESRSQITGWAGRMADCLTDTANFNPTISMNIAIQHLNIMQTGENVIPYIIQTNGAQLLSGYGSTNVQDQILTKTTDSLLEQTYSDLLAKTHARSRRGSIDAAIDFNNAFNGVVLNTTFPNTNLGRQLEALAKTIGARESLDQKRQIFFAERGGWDHHDGTLTSQAVMLPEVSGALKAFYDATVELGIANEVVVFTISDFGRTLSSNGKGSDHAWGGNHIVMGGGVQGGHVYGQYPDSLAPGNPLDVGRGRLIPTTAVDEYNAELALWFGLQNDSNLETVLPNIRNFYASGASASPLGFMA